MLLWLEQLASYKVASHATAQRAVMAARQALRGVPEEATTSVDMDGAPSTSLSLHALTPQPQAVIKKWHPFRVVCGLTGAVPKHILQVSNCEVGVLSTSAPGSKPFLDSAGVVEAVAAAKRALSSHPLPDPFQPSGQWMP